MTSSRTQSFLNDIVGQQTVPLGKLSYFRARLAGRIHQALLTLFAKLESDRRFTRRELAKRIHRKPEQITRWLSYPNNLTLDTASDLFVGLGFEIEQVILVDLATGKKVVLPEYQVPVPEGHSALAALPPEGRPERNVRPFVRSSSERSSALSQLHAAHEQSNEIGLAERSLFRSNGLPNYLERVA